MAKTYIDNDGYLRFKDSNQLVHRWVLRKYGYNLRGHHQVHHIDGNKLNNDISNLLIVTRGEHERIHNRKVSFPYQMFFTKPFVIFLLGFILMFFGNSICLGFGFIMVLIGFLMLIYNLKYVYGYL